ncbi:MAG: LCP family protein [Candidatus Eremiobacteraeota bacterium]|nr:LCP family protein [Candidatus Eremiobacteraeota bacterium]MCW5872032.1 LCP family protein [Candidatus Eremiobacteraeota bacterium]
MQNAHTPPLKMTRWQRFRRIPSLLRLGVFSFCCMVGASGALAAGTLALKFDDLVMTEPPRAYPNSTDYHETPPPACFKGNKRMNILVLGIDYNHDPKSIIYTEGARSDSMMVVSLASDGSLLNVVSIPRDLYVPLSAYDGSDRINAAYSYGGVKKAKEAVSHLMGIPLHHHVIVKVYGAKKVIDAIGGVDLEVEKDMDYDDNWGGLHVHLKKGKQHLNGEQTVGYARFRKDNTRIDMEGDVGRMRRQQQVIRGLLRTTKDPAIVARFPAIARAVKDTLETDFSMEDMLALANLYKGFDIKQVHGGQIKGTDDLVGEAMVLIPTTDENNQTVRRLLKDSVDLGLRDVRIRILNNSGEPGLGNRLADDMNSQGYNVVMADDVEHRPTQKTQVTLYTRCPRVQPRLRALFPTAQFRDSASPSTDYDILITVGADRGFLAKKAAPEPPSASHWPEPQPELPKPKVILKPRLPETRPIMIDDEVPAPLPTPTHPDAEGTLRTEHQPGGTVRG